MVKQTHKKLLLASFESVSREREQAETEAKAEARAETEAEAENAEKEDEPSSFGWHMIGAEQARGHFKLHFNLSR